MKKITELNKYKNYLKNVAGYSCKTIITYSFYVEKLLEYNCDYKSLMNCIHGQTNNTKRIILSAIKSYFKYSNNKLAKEIILPKKNKRLMSHISLEEYKKLIVYNRSNDFKTLIIRMLFETGIRSNEFLSIRISDIKNQKIVINGKGNKQRIIYISQDFSLFIEKIIRIKNLSENDFLVNFNYRNLYKHVVSVGHLINKHLTPHMFRRGFATYCIDKDIGIYEICLMMGHENINTTKTYLHNEHRLEIMKSLFD